MQSLGHAGGQLLYADVDGNIGYQMTGHVPIRARGEGLVPSPGWSGQYEWTACVPFEELPHAFNPPDGLWANANQHPARHSSLLLRSRVHRSARYQRIRQVLERKQRHSAVDFGALQADEVSLPARRIAELLVAVVTPSGRRTVTRSTN